MNSARSETLYVTRSVKSGLEALAMLASAHDATPDTPLASVDAMADQILREHLDAVPELVERRRAIRQAIAEIDAAFAAKAKGAA